MATERRVFAGSLLEVREDGDGRTVTGLAAPYNQPTPIAGRFTETLVRGSFDLSGGVALHAGHDSELPVSPPGRMWEQGEGLYGEWKVSRTTAGDDLLTLIGDRAVRGLSVSFEPNGSRDLWDGLAAVIRYHCRLLNVAAVTRPAYAGAQVLSVRAGKEPYGEATYADPGYQADKVKRYPVDTEEHVHAAWSYISQPKNAAKYSPNDLAKVKARIKAAAQKFAITITSEVSPRAAQQLLERRASLYARQDAGCEPWRGVRDPRLAQRFLEAW